MDRNKSKRKVIDCRDLPDVNGCTLRISGKEKEVLTAAIRHSVEEHGHKYTAELKKQLKELLKDE
ncbi:MAG: DUF1059 domain-containing protein [Bacteroidetes bacterium]|nr:DUF1059 domain-containing protein [Bacteroidota bacterium]